MEDKEKDDGSLDFLNIPRDENNRSFNCNETTQSRLVNTTFWLFDFIENVPTRFSKAKGNSGQTLDYVGYLFYRKQKLIRKSIKQNFCRAAAKLNHKQPVPPLNEYKQVICPWLGWAKHSNSKHLLQTIIKKEYYGNL